MMVSVHLPAHGPAAVASRGRSSVLSIFLHPLMREAERDW